MAFNATNKLPGVYIDEIDVPGPIAGVATSVLAIVGPAQAGPINTPKLVTNPTQFEEHFGKHFKDTTLFASHAVMGYFENGGSLCYFVRASSGAQSSFDINDSGGNPTLVVTALEEGPNGDQIQVTIELPANPGDEGLLGDSKAARGATKVAGGGATGTQATVNDASAFRAGDVVLFDDGGGTTETATIASIDLGANKLTLASALTNNFAAGVDVRITDIPAGATSLRIEDSAGFEAGSIIEISQGGTDEPGVVTAVEGAAGRITLAKPTSNAFTMDAGDQDVRVRTVEFNLIVKDTGPNPSPDEKYTGLSLNRAHTRFVKAIIPEDKSKMISVKLADNPANPTPPPDNLPVAGANSLGGGVADDPHALTAVQYQAAINSLERIDDVTMLAIPDRIDLAVQGDMISHCEKMKDRFAILDPMISDGPTEGVLAQKDAGLNSDSGYAALYYPRIWISNPDTSPNAEPRILVPPSGHLAGVFARTDDTKGVHKAPANEQIRGVLGMERILTEAEAGLLNEKSVNVLRRVPNRGFRIWGARTLSPNTQWRYVNVRRLLLFIEESIQEGTEFAVFEPNNPSLWKTVKRQVDDFLTTVWATGAFVGVTPETSFKVRVDEELNPPSQVALGILTFEVKVYPAPPAEFIVFRIIQQPGGPSIEEA